MFGIETLVIALDLLGTFVFAISGAMAGVNRRLDIFGILVLAFVAGNFGGIGRDLVIGAVPPAALADWRYLLVSVLAGLITFFWYAGVDRLRSPVLLFDAAGLSRVLGDAPMVRSPGRLFDVETVYLPSPADRREERLESRMAAVIWRALDECGLDETVRALQSLERAEKIEQNDPERRFTERLARQNQLLKRLREASEKPNITHLAGHFRVSRRTILRDLHDLIQRGQLDAEVYPDWNSSDGGA